MRVVIKLFTGMKKYLPKATQNGAAEISVPDNATVKVTIEELGIPDEIPKMILVNRRHAAPGQILADGDIVSVLRPIAGG